MSAADLSYTAPADSAPVYTTENIGEPLPEQQPGYGATYSEQWTQPPASAHVVQTRVYRTEGPGNDGLNFQASQATVTYTNLGRL